MTAFASGEAAAGRRARLQEDLRRHGLGAALVGPSADLAYLTGLEPPLPTRLTMLVVPATGPERLVTPRLEAPDDPLGLDVTAWQDGGDAIAALAGVLDELGVAPDAGVAVSDRVWARYLLPLQAQRPGLQLRSAAPHLDALRAVKDDDELSRLELANAAVARVTERFGEISFAGRRELDVADDLAGLMTDEGHEECSFIIVGSGPNGANPHHAAGDRVIQRGDAVVVDIGGRLGGYHSDITRMVAVGDVSPGLARLCAVLEDAHAAVAEVLRPGVTGEQADAAARGVIERAGLGERFVHRTGHGLGLDEHEAPYLVAGSREPLLPGMVFSIEPGIYLTGELGARLEDIVALTEDGFDRLTETGREIRIVS